MSNEMVTLKTSVKTFDTRFIPNVHQTINFPAVDFGVENTCWSLEVFYDSNIPVRKLKLLVSCGKLNLRKHEVEGSVAFFNGGNLIKNYEGYFPQTSISSTRVTIGIDKGIDERIRKRDPKKKVDVLEIRVVVRLMRHARMATYDENYASNYLMKNYLKLLNNGKYSDFTLVVDEKEFKVNKAILGTASDVFDKIFSTDMIESQTGKCVVSSIDATTFGHLLNFVYGALLPDNLDDASVLISLYEAAHYFLIEQLKEICQQEIHARLSAKNAWSVYKWAHIYDKAFITEAWKVVKSDILKITRQLKTEPPMPELIEAVILQREKEENLWDEL